MNDRRRTNAPNGGTKPPIYSSLLTTTEQLQSHRPIRARQSDEPRKIFLKTGLIPSASGSAYLELQSSSNVERSTLIPPSSSLKITCAVHGPKPLPRSAPFSPHLVLSTHLKFAPFAARQRRGYIRDAVERDLGVHLEAALRGVIIGDRWPKSGVDVIITVLEGEEDRWWGDETGGGNAGVGLGSGEWGMMSVLAGSITVASAAITDAGIDCVDLVAGGFAAIVKNPTLENSSTAMIPQKEQNRFSTTVESVVPVLDPCPSEHQEIVAACVVGYLSGRDEITELWLKGDATDHMEELINKAVEAAVASRTVLVDAVKEAAELKFSDRAPQLPGGILALGNRPKALGSTL